MPGTTWNSTPALATAWISASTASLLRGLPATSRITSCPAATSSASCWAIFSGAPETSRMSAAVGAGGRGGRRRAPFAFASAHKRSYASSAALSTSSGTASSLPTTARTPSSTCGSVSATAVRPSTSRALTVKRSGLPGPAPTKMTFPGAGEEAVSLLM